MSQRSKPKVKWIEIRNCMLQWPKPKVKRVKIRNRLYALSTRNLNLQKQKLCWFKTTILFEWSWTFRLVGINPPFRVILYLYAATWLQVTCLWRTLSVKLLGLVVWGRGRLTSSVQSNWQRANEATCIKLEATSSSDLTFHEVSRHTSGHLRSNLLAVAYLAVLDFQCTFMALITLNSHMKHWLNVWMNKLST